MNKLNKFLLILLIVEIVFGGGGRLLEPFGIPPLRYVFFFSALLLFGFNLLTGNTKFTYASIEVVIVILLLPLYGMFNGVIHGNNIKNILFDLQPFLYILILFFLCFNNKHVLDFSVNVFLKVVKYYATIASFLYILYIVLLRVDFINFLHFYSALSLTSEFFFRPGGAFFAKSFFFLGIGAILFFIEKKNILFLLCMIAIFLTETRGVFLFAGLSVLIASTRIYSMSKVILLFMMALLAGIALMFITGARAGASDSVRLNDLAFVISHLTVNNFIFGLGFGSEVVGRGRIEVVPLELLYKTGSIGIILSILPLLWAAKKTFLVPFDMKKLQVFCTLLFSSGVSITNPFLYTPMGIFVLGITICACCISGRDIQFQIKKPSSAVS